MRVICDFSSVLTETALPAAVPAGGGVAEALPAAGPLGCDPSFVRFAAWCEAEGLPLSLACDEVEALVFELLARHGLGRVDRHVAAANDQASSRAECSSRSGVCRCEIATAAGAADDILVYVGQSGSDFCASARAGVLFARGELAEYAAARNRGYFPFGTFDDVAAIIGRLRRPNVARCALQLV